MEPALRGDSIHTSWRFVDYDFVLQPLIPVWASLGILVGDCVRGWQREHWPEPCPVPQPFRGRWQMERVPWPWCCSAATPWFLTSSSTPGRAAGCTNHCVCSSLLQRSGPVTLPISLLPFHCSSPSQGQSKTPEGLPEKQILHKNQLTSYIAGDIYFLGASHIELY